ncbi:MAG: site-2 protease family protein [Hyphomonadaceae bacterium]|nr:site-2 protease family protein [Hyphomonadaceae bacterium]
MNDPWTRPRAGAQAAMFNVSPVFIGLVVLFVGIAYALAVGRGGPFGVFALALVGWIISLCLHEWGHAASAWASGDRSVAERGYLTLDPLRYAHPFMSIVLPLLFLAMGGIGFPGGAVYVNKDAVRTPLLRSAVSAAGPAMNLVCLLAIGAALTFLPMSAPLAAGLAFLGVLQATALILNLLPVPGLDGFGILENVFPAKERAMLQPLGQIVAIGFLIAIFTVPQLLQPIWSVALLLCEALGVDRGDIAAGYEQFRFWEQ